jgi:hypothetical protein
MRQDNRGGNDCAGETSPARFIESGNQLFVRCGLHFPQLMQREFSG